MKHSLAASNSMNFLQHLKKRQNHKLLFSMGEPPADQAFHSLETTQRV